MIITSNLKVKMAEFNYSIKDVHEKTKLSRTTISNLYNNYSDGIKIDTLEKLCDLFNCTPNDLLKSTYLEIENIEYEKLNHVYGLNEDRTFNKSEKLSFYKANVQLKLNNIPYSIELRLIIESSNSYSDSGLEIGILRLEEYENTFIGESLNATGLVSVPLSNKIEETVLNDFIKNHTNISDYDVIEDIEYTFK
ncbi:helix-turn-helix transcriptional regulator [Staphylococcus lugdunensis]|uniref:Helix-turn-helix transcriptional regulator n=3 Tax=Staphylococcus TaxID=1279 RepID=A0ABX6BYQ7_STALU|nr:MULTISPECIES: helix-turn-helix transcriptional regulator [Staphylococcus]ARJ16908.1 transcriptional regulator [Staphylococcus lugdunensis]MCC3715514.1 helix-turn-helix transcriptional regulator [Staphylococcus haemolyticus]MCH4361258.1 helix-turn-helix transcriptional regulator [Staphylococcus haemolyticus]MCH4422114.1 helix-turn-helix transcriptional regulator [Staphylococcus haemolyticus]MCH4431702.1 helix-turn-helix transcriptional regulator [Staphylococcus haemolyticus]